MGDEYKLLFEHSDARAVAACLRLLSGASASPSDELRIEFRSSPDRSRMPDAISVVKPSGVYFCVNGGDGRAFLGHAVVRLISNFGPIRIDDYEEQTASITLLVVRCSNLDQSLRFYEALGLLFTPEQHDDGPHHYSCKVGQAVLELYPAAKPTTVRLGLALPNIQMAVNSIREMAGSVLRFDEAVPTHAVVRDPDGNTLELSTNA